MDKAFDWTTRKFQRLEPGAQESLTSKDVDEKQGSWWSPGCDNGNSLKEEMILYSPIW